MEKIIKTGALVVLAIAVLAGLNTAQAREKKASVASKLGGGKVKVVANTMPENTMIAASSAKGSPAYHRHLVRPGAVTTYSVRVMNAQAQPIDVDLSLAGAPPGWNAKLAKTKVHLEPGKLEYVLLEVSPSAKLAAGSAASFEVAAKSSAGKTEKITLEAETTGKHKIYYVSIDSLGTEYLKLNAKGNGPGKDNDWLMPNLHALIKEGTFYPNHKAHLVSATDMNHAAFLSGAYPGELGIYSVNVFLFGFDEKGNPIIKATPLDIMYYGKDGKPVTNIFNVIKDPAAGGNPNAFDAYVSGKDWVPEHYLNPVFGVDRIATVNRYPDYVTPSSHIPKKNETVMQVLRTQFGKYKDNDAFLWEDIYTIDQAIEVVNNEDPDVCYILLGGVDAAGHVFGAAHDLSEWDAKNTPDELSDDVSKVNRRANRLGQIKTVKTADEQLGRFVAYLKTRGTFDDSIMVVESDHDMETNFFAGPKLEQTLAKTGYSPKKDYFMFTVTQIGALFLRPGRKDPNIIPSLEKALEDYRMENPLTHELECPMVVYTREEMKTGIDKVTGQRFSPPGELYSEYYIEHPKPGNLSWPDMMLFTKKYYQFPLMGVGLANVGAGKLNIPLPKINIFVGGHGGPSTQPALLMFHGPGVPKAVAPAYPSMSADVAPTLYGLEGYKAPAVVQGKVLTDVARPQK